MIAPLNDGSLEVQDWRDRIDAIDQVIANLLVQRADVSRQIQDRRIRSGGARVDLSREREVMQTYIDTLGAAGRDVAHSVLVFSRGSGSAVHRKPEGAEVPCTGERS